MQPNTRRLVQLTLPTANIATDETLDMLSPSSVLPTGKHGWKNVANLAEV